MEEEEEFKVIFSFVNNLFSQRDKLKPKLLCLNTQSLIWEVSEI